MARWTIKEVRSAVEVWKDRKRLGTHDTVEEVHAVIRKGFAPGDTVHHEEVDGYRTNVTNQWGQRRGWRR